MGKCKEDRKAPQTLEEKIAWAKTHGYDCIVQCPKCKRTQYLEFKNGLRNGWSTCCGDLTMPIIWQEANIDEAVKNCIESQTAKPHGMSDEMWLEQLAYQFVE